MEERIKCTYCSEEILTTAKKCKHCYEWLDSSHQLTQKIIPPSAVVLDSETLIKQSLAGKYQILSEICKGDTATLYKAIQINLIRTLTLKVIHLNIILDEEFLRGFKSGYIL